MIIPPDKISPDVLKNVLESYITREGTDYGEEELPLTEKTARLHALVASGEVLIVYDEEMESLNLINKTDYQADYPD